MATKRIRSPLTLLLAAGAVAVGACGELTTVPSDAPTVQVLTSDAVAGTAIPLRLHNPTSVSWTFSTCPGAFQRLEDGAWIDLPPALMICAAEVPVISPGETVDAAAFLLTEAPAGTYRAVVLFESAGTDVERYSSTFTVEALSIGDAPTVFVLESSVARGDQATVRIVNMTTLVFLRNLCSDGRLQRLVGGEWIDTPEPVMLCTAALYPIAPGAFADEAYPVFPELATGTYRMRVRLWREGADAVLRYSNSFTVT